MRIIVTCPACQCELYGSTYDVPGEPLIAGEAGRVASTHTGMPIGDGCGRATCTCHGGSGHRHSMVVSLLPSEPSEEVSEGG